jgi:hypothetical protein
MYLFAIVGISALNPRESPLGRAAIRQRILEAGYMTSAGARSNLELVLARICWCGARFPTMAY